MNAASIKKSKRLQRVWKLLQGGGSFTTRQIVQYANVCAVNSCVAELRQSGKYITCQRKGDRWYYKAATL